MKGKKATMLLGGLLLVLVLGLAYLKMYPKAKVLPVTAKVMPAEMKTLFEGLNNGLGTKFSPLEADKFYSIQGEIEKKSWTIDFTSAIKGKAQMVIVKDLLEKELTLDLTKSAGGAGQSVDAYNGKTIECFLLLGLDKKDLLTCASK